MCITLLTYEFKRNPSKIAWVNYNWEVYPKVCLPIWPSWFCVLVFFIDKMHNPWPYIFLWDNLCLFSRQAHVGIFSDNVFLIMLCVKTKPTKPYTKTSMFGSIQDSILRTKQYITRGIIYCTSIVILWKTSWALGLKNLQPTSKKIYTLN